MQKSLKKSSLISFLIYIIGFTLIFGSLYIYTYYNSQMKEMHYQQKLILENIKQETTKLLFHIEDISLYIKTNYLLEQNLITNLVNTHQNISYIVVLDENGIIKDISYEGINNIYKGFDFSNKDYFKKISNKNEEYWSDTFLSSLDNEPTLTYSFKSADDVIVIFVKLVDLNRFAKRFKNADNSYMVRVFDRNLVFLINPDGPQLVKQRVNAKATDIYKGLISKGIEYTLEKIQSDFNNKTNIAMYSKIEKNDWHVVVRQSYEVFEKFITFFIISASLLMLILMGTGLFLVLKVQKRVYGSYLSLVETIEKISNGNYNIKLGQPEYLEFNKLISAFIKMKDEILRREKVLEQSANNFKNLVDTTMEAIIIHDTNLCIDVNLAAVKLFGYKNKKEMIGLKFLDLFCKDSLLILRKNLFINTQPYEFKILTKAGKEVESLGRGVFLETPNKRVKVTAIIDISELKAKDKLLAQQSKMAAMGEMIENIAHQWRQPLSAISTAASGLQVCEEFNLDSKENRQVSLESIMTNSLYLSRTIDDFRNFFKIDKELVKINLQDTFKNILSLINPTLNTNHIKVITNIKKDIYIKGYKNEFLQSIINILNNSKDAFIINKIKNKIIKIDVYNEDTSIIIEISDSAGGISKEHIYKIFDPYFTTKHKSQGTGIGLYMTHQMLSDHMNAKINVYNDELEDEDCFYKGVVFKIEFKA